MDRVKHFFCFIFVLVLVGCSDTKQLSPLSTDDTILAFGDSLTYGVGAKNGKTYPEVLSELTGIQVINAGVSGETTSKGILRFSDVLDEHQPQLIILLEGGNDVLRNHPPSQTKSNLA
ncbi:GDSL-type esterase/lipase family protein [Litoribacillus peritrichatus]|uniref:SGNH hydrolase-type esterase domain-containing protein n=1 Tax=Litoribacillus peritrichatus TaxID=718191 RepID=A0ABP7MEM6_9GAMM